MNGRYLATPRKTTERETMKRFGLWAIALATAALLAGCGTGEAEAPPYPILDSGFPASTNDKLYWLDNDRVIFVSYGPKPKSLEEAEKHPRVPSINIWDTRTNKVALYKNSAKGLCADGAYIQYAIAKVPYDPEYQPRWYAGQVGQEREITLPPGRLNNSVIQNPHTCRWVERPEYARGRRAMPLREGDGWLVGSNPSSVNELGEWLLYRPDGTAVNTGAPTNLHMVSWVGFAQKYFMSDYTNGRPKSGCMRYWWIQPDGSISAGCQDVAPLLRQWKGNVGLNPTPVGILVSAVKLTDHDRIGGFYQVKAGKAKLVLKYGGTWSPDGCKAAYVDVPGWEGLRVGGQGDSRLQIINVCATKTKGDKP